MIYDLKGELKPLIYMVEYISPEDVARIKEKFVTATNKPDLYIAESVTYKHMNRGDMVCETIDGTVFVIHKSSKAIYLN